MSTQALSTPDVDAPEQVHKRMDLARRFMLAGFEDTRHFEDIPWDVVLFHLPDYDPAFVENEIAAGAASARRGNDVYFRHVRTADLPQ
jgi:hypothetical protein